MTERVFLAIFPFFFVGMWVLVSWFLTASSGWLRLQQRYPDRPEQLPVERFRFQSASFASFLPGGVQYSGCLTFDVCVTGLRVRVWRLLGLFSQPFFVPWSDIYPEKKRLRLVPFYLLRRYALAFGTPEVGRMILAGRAAQKIEAASRGALKLPFGD